MKRVKNQQRKKHSDQSASLVVHHQPTSGVSEQFRTIRTNIQFSMVDNPVKTIVVTSAAAGSGKSFVSANLAATFAAGDKKVLLVDADLRKPTVHRIFGFRNFNGLTTMLTDRHAALNDMVLYSRVPNLFVLPSGAIPPNPSELLSSNRMDTLTAQMREEYDMVIFDMPPVLPVTDAQIMASKTDGTIFVIPKGEVAEEDVMKSKQLLEMVDAHVLGAVFNRVDASEEPYYYYGDDTL